MRVCWPVVVQAGGGARVTFDKNVDMVLHFMPGILEATLYVCSGRNWLICARYIPTIDGPCLRGLDVRFDVRFDLAREPEARGGWISVSLIDLLVYLFYFVCLNCSIVCLRVRLRR